MLPPTRSPLAYSFLLGLSTLGCATALPVTASKESDDAWVRKAWSSPDEPSTPAAPTSAAPAPAANDAEEAPAASAPAPAGGS
jgi:hypothetical protein